VLEPVPPVPPVLLLEFALPAGVPGLPPPPPQATSALASSSPPRALIHRIMFGILRRLLLLLD
jgi:hypothetical protein